MLTTGQAEELILACLSAATEHGRQVSIAVVDREGQLMCARRPETLRWLTVELAQAKAYTAAVMERPTQLLETWDHAGPQLFQQLSALSGRTMMVGPGGMTIARDGVTLGGLGISGARAELDQRIAEHALATLNYQTEFEMDL